MSHSIRHQLRGEEGQSNRPVDVDENWFITSEGYTCSVRDLLEITTDQTEIVRQVYRADLRCARQTLVDSRDRCDTRDRVIEAARQRCILACCCLQLQHTCDKLKAVLHPMIDLADQHLLILERLPQLPIVDVSFKRNAKDVGGALEKMNVLSVELALKLAVDLEHTIGCTLSLQNDVDRPADTMLPQQRRGTKTLLVLEVVGNNRPSCLQGKPRGRFEIGTNRCVVDAARLPADTGPQHEPVLGRNILANLTEVCVESECCGFRSALQQNGDRYSRQRVDAKLRQQFLLPDP